MKAAAPLAAVPQAENAQYKEMVEKAFKSAQFGARNDSGILGMGGVSYLPATSGSTSYAASTLVSR